MALPNGVVPAVVVICCEPDCHETVVTYTRTLQLANWIALPNLIDPVLPPGWTIASVGSVNNGPQMAFCRCPRHAPSAVEESTRGG
jgi:hypothetical protein